MKKKKILDLALIVLLLVSGIVISGCKLFIKKCGDCYSDNYIYQTINCDNSDCIVKSGRHNLKCNCKH